MLAWGSSPLTARLLARTYSFRELLKLSMEPVSQRTDGSTRHLRDLEMVRRAPPLQIGASEHPAVVQQHFRGALRHRNGAQASEQTNGNVAENEILVSSPRSYHVAGYVVRAQAGRSIPSLFMRDRRVLGFSPRRLAALSFPLIFQPVVSRA